MNCSLGAPEWFADPGFNLRKDEAAPLQPGPFCAFYCVRSSRDTFNWLFHLLHEIGAYPRSFYLTTHEKCDHNNCAKCAARHKNEKSPV